MNVLYGDEIRLWSVSKYYQSEADVPDAVVSDMSSSSFVTHYLGYYEKNGRHGILSCLSPLGTARVQRLFCEEQYVVLDAAGIKSVGVPVLYGDVVVLVNQHGMVWNNRTGGITGYIGPRPRHQQGELHVSFVAKGDAQGEIKYLDKCIEIHVVTSNRASSLYDKPLTNYKKTRSQTISGYVCSDGKGYPLQVEIHPLEQMPDRVEGSLCTATPVEWYDIIPLKKSNDSAFLKVVFKSKGYGQILWQDVILNTEADCAILEVLLVGAPGTMSVKLIRTVNKTDSTYKIRVCNKSSDPRSYYLFLTLILAFLIWIFRKPSVLLQWWMQGVMTIAVSSVLGTILYQYVAAYETTIHEKLKTANESTYSYSIQLLGWRIHGKERGQVVIRDPAEQQNLEMPERFLVAEKGNIDSAKHRWNKTLQWRKDEGIDQILMEPHPRFTTIKKYYPHHFHLRGKNNEPVYYEIPSKIDLKALKKEGVSIDILLRHYVLITEFIYVHLAPSETSKAISIIDVEGVGIWDFVGEVVDFVKKASAFTSAHYPERAECIYIVNVPTWFNAIWNVIKPLIDETTRQKIYIFRGKKNIHKALLEKIPVENIPPRYSGTSVPLGSAIEEQLLCQMILRNNGEQNAFSKIREQLHPQNDCTFEE